MNPNESYQDRYNRAVEKVEEIRAFYNHAIIYVVINILLIAVNYYHNEWSFIWFIFPLLGWGIGLAAHGFGTFGGNPLTNEKWKERKIKEILEKEENNI
ncbi:2TM domain-containing protein [Nonlabens dokdonensis]|uniref:Membrane protein containing an internal histidine kinase domain n=2 Tax=Nonlabens dokdonensis TaxID=328515 RepID=L7WEU2_NONDD|nr:2TM domain-containing protein [Nonlabens dokdonensis]AGC78456.1 membrane protein containing an internal histidine kinase domain [Nonlabens dokdonensis DSW-6]PZX38201.1 2TM domain-containing protein [Nonlabens dokdonensis]